MSLGILLAQKMLGESIKAKHLQFQQTPAERRKRDYINTRLEALEKDWDNFKSNDQLLRDAQDIDGGHDYFKKDTFNNIHKIYIQYSDELEEVKTKLDGFSIEDDIANTHDQAAGFANPYDGATGFTQQYEPPADTTNPYAQSRDITNPYGQIGGAIPKRRTLDIFEEKEIPSDTSKDNPFPHMRQFKDIPFPSMGHEKGTPLSLDNMFKHASMTNIHNISQSHSETRNQAENRQRHSAHLLLLQLEKGIGEWNNATAHKASISKLRVLRGNIIRNYETFHTIQENFVGNKDYDVKPLLELQDLMVPILLQDQEDQDTFEPPHRQVVVQSSAKIPKLNMPIFDGDHVKWHSFKQLFTKMIDKKSDLDGCEKLAYLQGQLEGEPARLISTLPLENSSYNTAWNILSERFENTHVIVTKLFNKLLDGDPMKKFSIESMKEVMDGVRECVDTLINMGLEMNNSLNYVFYYLIERRIDRPTLSLYENMLPPSNTPRRYDDLMKFLRLRIQNLSAKNDAHQKTQSKGHNNFKKEKSTGFRTSLIAAAPAQIKQTSTKPAPSKDTSSKSRVRAECGDCKEKHPITQCPAFIAMTTEERYKKVKDWKRCVNCLREGHTISTCKSSSCRTCSKKHNTLLHDEKRIQKFKPSKAKALLGSAISNKDFKHVFLATAIVDIQDKHGQPIRARAVLDSGSQLNLITEKLLRKLGLEYTETSMKVSGIGTSSTESTKRITVQITSKVSGFKTHLELFVIKQITSCQPAQKIETNDWKIPKNISLADPHFNIPAPVDLVIGGELFFKLISIGMISIGETLPELQNTVFGWVVTGKVLGLEPNKAFVGISTEQSLEKQVSQFWKMEEKNLEVKPMTLLEQSCEKFFEETTTRNEQNGKFIVQLQFTKEPSILGNSEKMALRRFLYLEKRFARDPDMKEEYVKFLREYEDLGHMSQINRNRIGTENYFIPHHAVRNPGSSTTKFRVVFDASSKTTTNVSLNEILANGPVLQEDLFSIIARFRTHQYVFSADITKMYRQVEVHPNHRKWQLLIWRENQQDPLKYYQLNTLTYGTKCAAYLAIKPLQKLADNHSKEHPKASIIAKRDFNVDDVMTGSNNIQEALTMQEELIDLCKKGNFHLHKWCSNHPMLLERIPKNKQEISLDFNAEKTETKALGMKWIPKTDIFMLSYCPKHHNRITKRTVLSETAQLFDPLGLVNPVIVLAKIFLQELWELKLNWDAALPMALNSKWSDFRNELIKLNEVQLSRHMVIENPIDIQLHAFSDASIRAYGSVFYLRSKNKEGKIQVTLICSKSRVAPISTTTLPRLELSAGVTSAEIAIKLNKVLGLEISSTTYWTDSELVLSWLYTDATYKTFVANRVAFINRKSDPKDWKYIPTKENPADLISRGVLPEKLINSKLWWNGPEFLQKPEHEWPEIKPAFKKDPSEERSIKTVLTVFKEEPHFIERIQHRNSIRVLQRVVAYILRFPKTTAKNASERAESAILTAEELKTAMITIIKYIQDSCFKEEIALVRNGKGNKTKFSNFVPIIDADGVLRVGGRLQASNMPFEQKHPALLPKNHHITKLIMERIHVKNMHAGPQALLATVRQKYWPENGKRLAQAIVRKCVLCARSKPVLMEQIMGNLPADRVNQARPFSSVCLDFCGPVIIHHKIRGKRTTKAYVCVFACLTTKAVHLEPASDLSTEGFVNCLKRFIARRAAPKRIICDNATNFRGLYNQLTELTNLMHNKDHQNRVIRYCQDHEIEWKFAPPRSPHFNGLAEAAVKSAKFHIRKIIHSMELTYDELGTIIAEIEAILNSRPLTPMSSDPNDLQPLTPGHFLVGKPLTCINDVDIPYTSKTKMWHKIVRLRNEFWKSWSKEYIAELQGRKKWTAEKDNIKMGTLVIIHDDNIAPLKWKMGRVTNIIYDDNGKARVVDLHTSTTNMDKAVNKTTRKINVNLIKTHPTTLRRAIHRICPLPIDVETSELPTNTVASNLPIENKTSEDPIDTEASDTEIESEAPLKQQRATRNKPVRNPNKMNQQIQPKKVANPTTAVVNKNRVTSGDPAAPVASRTRSKALNTPAKLLILALTFMAIVTSAFGKQCDYTSFSHNPGLYFEQNGKMSLTNDKWNIVSYMKLKPFCDQIEKIGTLLNRLDKLCIQMEPSEYCNITTQQLRQKARTATDYNEIILGFSQHSLIRKRRECTDSSSVTLTEIVSNASKIFNQGMELTNKEELLTKASMLSQISQNILKNTFSVDNTIQKIANHKWNQISEKVLQRKKRGWANFIGSSLKVVGGVMDDDDAIRIENQVNQLNSSYQHVMHLISNQTSILDITENIMKREATAISEQLSRLETELNFVKDGNQTTKFDIYNIMALQTLMVIISHKETQNAIIELMSQIHHGKIPVNLITPAQLKSHLDFINSKIRKDIMIPGNSDPVNLIQIYNILHAKIKITKNTILIKTTLPLIHRDYFDMYHIIPLPFMISDTSMHMIETTQHYIGINKLLDRYYLLTHNERAECQAFSTDLIICEQKHILYTAQNDMPSCEMAIFTHPAKGISPKCTLKEFQPAQVWSKLMTPNQFLFTVPKQVTFNIICENGSTICTASDSGIISLPQRCTIQTNHLEIAAENTYQSELPTVLVPEINISSIIGESIDFTARSTSAKKFQLDSQYKELEDAIKAQKNAEELTSTTFSWHDVHHYTAVYVMFGMIAVVIIGFIWAIRRYKSTIFIPRVIGGEEIENTRVRRTPMASPRSQPLTIDQISF